MLRVKGTFKSQKKYLTVPFTNGVNRRLKKIKSACIFELIMLVGTCKNLINTYFIHVNAKKDFQEQKIF